MLIENPHARVKMRAKLFDGNARNVVNAQHGWWLPEQPPPDYGVKTSNANLFYGDGHFDPESGTEPFKGYLRRVLKLQRNDRFIHTEGQDTTSMTLCRSDPRYVLIQNTTFLILSILFSLFILL